MNCILKNISFFIVLFDSPLKILLFENFLKYLNVYPSPPVYGMGWFPDLWTALAPTLWGPVPICKSGAIKIGLFH